MLEIEINLDSKLSEFVIYFQKLKYNVSQKAIVRLYNVYHLHVCYQMKQDADTLKKGLYLNVRVFSTVVLNVDTVTKQTNITNITELLTRN